MRKKGARRFLAGLMCISFVFQSNSVTTFAEGQSVQKEIQEHAEETVTDDVLAEPEGISDDVPSTEDGKDDTVQSAGAIEHPETEGMDTEDSEPKQPSGTENTGTEETETAGNPDTKDDAAEVIEQPETEDEMVEGAGVAETEQNAEEVSKTEAEGTDGTVEDAEPGSFANVSVEFDGYRAALNGEYTLSSNAESAQFWLVSYSQDGNEITSETVYDEGKEDTGIYHISEMTVNLYNEAERVKLKAVETNEAGEEINVIFSDEFVRGQIPEIHFSAGDPEIEVGSITIPYYFDGNMYRPEGKEGTDFNASYSLKYGIGSIDESSTETSGSIYFRGEENEAFSVTLTGLEAEAAYQVELFITIQGTDFAVGNIYEQAITLTDLTMPAEETYDLEQAFPDEVFRQLIRDQLSLEASATTVKESQLGTITYLYGSRNDITAPAIRDIRGIELLYNAINIELNGHEITDVSGIAWERLPKLTNLQLRGNCIETLPDLTKNTGLQYLYISDNFISSTEILDIQDKLPEGCNCWDYGQRQKEFALITEEKYYQSNGKSEVVLRVQGYNAWFSPTFKMYIDNDLTELESISFMEDGYSYLILRNEDIPFGAGTHTLKLEMYQGTPEQMCASKEADFEIVEQKTFIADPSDTSRQIDVYYMSAQAEYLSVYTYGAKEVSEIYLVKDGTVYGKNDYLSSEGSERYLNKYPNLGNYGSNGFYYNTNASVYINKKVMSVGVYDLKLVNKDGTEELLEGTVEVVDTAIIRGVSAGYSYDHTGEYLYLALTADYLDPSRISYTVRESNTNRALQVEYIDCKPIYGGYVVKLKKTGWGSNITNIKVSFSGTEDYPLYSAVSESNLYIEGMMYFSSYNYQANMLEVGITSQTDVSDYTYSIVRTDSPWDFSTEHIQEEYAARLEEVEDTVYRVIPIWEGEDCTLYGGYYQFSVLRPGGPNPIRTSSFYIPGLVVERTKTLNDNGFWEYADYPLIQQGTGRVSHTYYSEITYVEGNAEDFSAQITGNTLDSPLDAQSVRTWNHSADVYKTGIGMEFDYSSLGVGNYTVELYYLGNKLSEREIQVIPNDIFVLYDDAYAYWGSEDTFYLNFYTPNCGESDDYTILMTDISGVEVEGLTVSNSYKYLPYVNLSVSGLKKSEADRWYYIKLLHKTKGDAYRKDLETSYYNERGKYTRIDNNSKLGWNNLNVDGENHGYTGIWTSDKDIFPASFAIYKFNGTECVYSNVWTEENFDGYNYHFTQEVIDALPRPDGYYDLVLVGNNGQSLYAEGVQVTLNEALLNAFRVEPSSMTLKLDIADESSREITVFNSTETTVFESDDTTVAEVTVSDDDPNIAVVKAVGVGTTSITVTSGSNIKKVAVVVTETPVEAEKIQFQAADIKVVQGMTASADVKVEPEKAWTSSSRISYTSSDETIVSVGDSTNRNITLTANRSGTATITAKLEGTGLTAQCTVTVVAGLTEEEKNGLVSAVGKLYFLEGAEHTLEDIRLPEGFRWANPSQKPTADDARPVKEFTAIYAKDGLDYFLTPLSVYVTRVSTGITGVTEMHISTKETYKCRYEFIGYKPADNTTYAASFQWGGNDNLKIQGGDDRDEVTVQAGTIPGNYVLQCKIFIKNTKTGEEFTDTLRHTVAVKDNTDEINEAVRNRMYYFLAGADSRLGDIPIGDGWSWVRPETVPQADVSIQVQNFEAKYEAPGRQPETARMSVAVAALDQVNISGPAKVAAEKNSSYRLSCQFSGYDMQDTDGYTVSYRWKGSDGITVDGADSTDTVTVRTGSASGTHTISAEVTVTNRQTGNASKAEGSYRIQVLEKGSVDSITVRPADRQPEKALACAALSGELVSDYTAFDRRDSFLIQLTADTMSGGGVKDIPVRWESSDPKVAAIDEAGLVTVKKSGVTVISATSTDQGEYSEEIALKIQDHTPTLENKAITVFQYGTMGTDIGLTAQCNNRIQSVETGVSGLKVSEYAGVWYLQASGYSKKTVENTTLAIVTEKGKYEKPLRVTVNVTQPKATLKQSVKPNIFYTDAEAVYKVTSKYAIARIEDASGISKIGFRVKDYDAGAGLLTLKPYGIAENIESYKVKNSDALTAKIKITFEGYTTPAVMEIKVGVTNRKPSLRIDTAVLMKDAGMDEALTVVRNGRTIYHLGNAAVNAKTENVGVSVFDGRLKLIYNGTSNITYKVDIQDENWTQAATVSGKIRMVNANALGLQAETTKITVNKANLSTIVIPVAIKGNNTLEPDIRINYDSTAMNADYRNGAVEIDVLESAQDKTYKVEVGGTLSVAGRTADVNKAVIKVTVTGKEASVKLFASGKINIADRKYSSTIYTPTLKNMDANIIKAEVTGDMSEYFYAYLDQEEKVVLKAVSGKPLKADMKYTVDIATSFDNGYQTVTKVNIKPVNNLPKVKASLARGTLYKAGKDSRLGIKLTLDARYQISRVRLAESPDSEYFTLSHNESGLVTIGLSENGVKMPSGTYTVSYHVLIADADNAKPITRKLRIVVK